MTQKEIIEGNKLIAEFMGYEKTIYSDVFRGELYALDVSKGEIYAISQMQYHTSWDWIMPVVEKIESIEDCEKNNFQFSILSDNECEIFGKYIDYQHPRFSYLNCVKENSKIKSVYKTAIDFIKWYNENK
jgi:hypothetical protein